ncbi:MAG: hypothetical protein ACPL5F_05000 [Moorellaceae bacterium]
MALIWDDEYQGPRYRYGLQYRPPSLGAVPSGYILGSERPHPKFHFGTLDYPRKLTEDEVLNYQLVYLDQF